MKSKAGDDSVVNGTHYKYFVDGRGAGAGWGEAEKHKRIKTNKTGELCTASKMADLTLC